jgi:hypothetical protein
VPWLLALLASPAPAGEPVFTPELQFRPRFELDSGRDGDPSDGVVAFVTHRARLGASMEWGPITARLVVQDVRAWGEEIDTREDFSADGFDLAIGTLVWRPHDHVQLTLGREQVSLHDERLVAQARWRQPGRSFDGGRFTWANGTWAAEVAGYITIDGDNFQFDIQDQVEPARGDQTLSWVRGGLETEDTTAQLVVTLDDRRENEGNEVLRATPGFYLNGTRGIWSTQFDVYGQFGRIAGGDQAVRAGLVGVDLTVAPDWPAAPRLSLAYDGMTGDGDLTDDVFTSFDTLRGANHRHYGILDYAVFFRGGPATAEGLHDPHLRVQLHPSETLAIHFDQHLFAPAVPRGETWVALEPDLELFYRPYEVLTIRAGGSAWFEVGTPEAPEWFGYLMIDVDLRGPEIGG